jgi:hypothetical protein
MFCELCYQGEMTGINTSGIADNGIDQRTEKKIVWAGRKVETPYEVPARRPGSMLYTESRVISLA